MQIPFFFNIDFFKLKTLYIISEEEAHFSTFNILLFRFDEAAEMVRKEMGFHHATENSRAVGRLVVALVLVHLMREDYVAADKAFKEGYK